MGDGVVIAVLDTGVDNEHFSLDDFSDANQDNQNEPSDLNDPKWVADAMQPPQPSRVFRW